MIRRKPVSSGSFLPRIGGDRENSVESSAIHTQLYELHSQHPCCVQALGTKGHHLNAVPASCGRMPPNTHSKHQDGHPCLPRTNRQTTTPLTSWSRRTTRPSCDNCSPISRAPVDRPGVSSSSGRLPRRDLLIGATNTRSWTWSTRWIRFPTRRGTGPAYEPNLPECERKIIGNYLTCCT